MSVTIDSVEKIPGLKKGRYVEARIDAPSRFWWSVVESDRYVVRLVEDWSYSAGWISKYTFRRTSDGTEVEGRALRLLTEAMREWYAAERSRLEEEERANFVKRHAKK